MKATEQPAKRAHVVRVRVTEQEKSWLDEIAARQDRSVSSVLRLALRDYYQRAIA